MVVMALFSLILWQPGSGKFEIFLEDLFPATKAELFFSIFIELVKMVPCCEGHYGQDHLL